MKLLPIDEVARRLLDRRQRPRWVCRRRPKLWRSDWASARVAETSEVVCWGLNDYGQLGYGHTDNIDDDELPVDAGPIELF